MTDPAAAPRKPTSAAPILIGVAFLTMLSCMGLCAVTVYTERKKSERIAARIQQEGIERKAAIERAVEKHKALKGVEWIRVGDGGYSVQVGVKPRTSFKDYTFAATDIGESAANAAQQSILLHVVPTDNENSMYCEMSFLASGDTVGEFGGPMCPIR